MENHENQPVDIGDQGRLGAEAENRSIGEESSQRVCDPCIRKKTKCDRKRPACSHCLERGVQCVYTLRRRKPGPLRGSTYERVSTRSRASAHTTIEAQENVGRQQSRPAPSFVEPLSGASVVNHSPFAIDITPQQETHLIEHYFEIVQDANPIFSKSKFVQEYHENRCNKDLVSAIVIITAKLSGLRLLPDETDLNESIDRMLSSSLLEDDMVGDSPSLDQFRKACVLAFYEFHQFPGHQSWKRIGNLTRLAYRIGLDRLEGIRAMYPDWRCLSLDEIQEWRSIWWCIYRLDTYSNLSAGTPFLIDPELTNTSLMLDSSASDPNPQELFLPAGFEDLWRLIPTITANPETLMRNIHIISIAATREAGSVARAFLCRRNSDFSTRLANTEKHLSTLLLALPQGWFNPRRNAFSNESHDFYYGRSITVLHFLMTRFLLAIVGCGQEKGEAWFISWQKVLGICQDISAAVSQWDNSFFMKVDPAISFIIFTALIFFDLHKKSATAASGLDEIAASDLCSAIEHQQNVLRLQLEQFAKFWMLPRLLCLSFAGFSESVPGPLSYHHVAIILSRFEAPLHPRWLQFLSSAHTILRSE